MGPVDVAVGYQYYRGAENQVTSSPTIELESDFADWSTTLAASRLDDNQSGTAWGVTGGLKVPLRPMVRLDVAGTGFAGDSTSGAWRLKGGPEVSLAIKDRTLGIFYVHYEGGPGVRSDGLAAEFETPLTPKLTSDASLSLEDSDGEAGEDGSVGLRWKPFQALELSGDVGLTRNAGGLTGLLPSRKAIRNANGAHGRKEAAVSVPVTGTLLLGVQAHF